MELLGTLPETRECAQQELLLQLTLGGALSVTRGYGSTETERAFVRVRDLSEQVGDVRQRFQALKGVWSIHFSRMEFDGAAELGEELLRMAERTRDPAQLLTAHMAVGATSQRRGEFSEAREHLEEVIGRYDPKEYRTQELLHMGLEDPWVVARSWLSSALFCLGYLSLDNPVMPRKVVLPVGETLSLTIPVDELCNLPKTWTTLEFVPRRIHRLRGTVSSLRIAREKAQG